MSETKHTPGPWEVVRHNHIDGDLWLSVNQSADAHGMKQWIAEIKYLTTGEPEQWANARLIAAAPRLLAACKTALQYADVSTAVVLRQAIAKAEGK